MKKQKLRQKNFFLRLETKKKRRIQFNSILLIEYPKHSCFFTSRNDKYLSSFCESLCELVTKIWRKKKPISTYIT